VAWQAPALPAGPRPEYPAVAPPAAAVAGAVTFAAVETGIESGAGVWGYLFLTLAAGRQPRGLLAAIPVRSSR
jgi:hypothetical protein